MEAAHPAGVLRASLSAFTPALPSAFPPPRSRLRCHPKALGRPCPHPRHCPPTHTRTPQRADAQHVAAEPPPHPPSTHTTELSGDPAVRAIPSWLLGTVDCFPALSFCLF